MICFNHYSERLQNYVRHAHHGASAFAREAIALFRLKLR